LAAIQLQMAALSYKFEFHIKRNDFMSMLIVVAVLIALMGFAISRHWKVREDKSVKNPRRQPRRR